MTISPIRGFTLLEFLIALGLIAVLLGQSAPSMRQYMVRNRLISATEALAGDLKRARSEATHRNKAIYVRYQPGTDWCGGLQLVNDCDCFVGSPTAEKACALSVGGNLELRTTTSTSYPGIVLIKSSFPGNTTVFSPLRGTSQAGTLRLQGSRDLELRIVLSMLGRVRICATRGSGMEHWYPRC